MVKFLVIRFSSIGDIVLTTPVVRALKQQVEEAEVHFLTKPAFAPLLENNPYLSKVHLLRENFSETIEELRNEGFDYVIDLHHNIRTYRIKQKMKVVAFSVDKLNYAKWLMVNFKKDRLPRKHIVDRYMETIRLFDAINDEKGLDYFLPAEMNENDKVLVADLPDKFIVYVAGAKHFTKKIPVSKAIEILQQIPIPIVLIGGKEDIHEAELIENEVKIVNLCGKLTLHGSAEIIRQSAVMITPDTGMMHIAAAFQKPIVSLWGNTIPEFGMYPYTRQEIRVEMEIKGLSCRPCTKIGFKSCPKKHFRCMNDIPAKEVAEKVISLIK